MWILTAVGVARYAGAGAAFCSQRGDAHRPRGQRVARICQVAGAEIYMDGLMDRPLPPPNRVWLALTLSLLAINACQRAPHVAQQEAESIAGAVPERFAPPPEARPVMQLASHLDISEGGEHIVSNPFSKLHRLPPVPPNSPAASDRPLDRLRLPIRIERSKKSTPAENSLDTPSREVLSLEPPAAPSGPAVAPPETASRPQRLARVPEPVELNPPAQSASKPSAEQFLASLAPEAEDVAVEVAPPAEEELPILPLFVSEASPAPLSLAPPSESSWQAQGGPEVSQPVAAQPVPALAPRDRDTPQNERALMAVRARMNSLVDHALVLAQRGAYFSARAEFIQALRLATQSLDTAEKTHRHSEALSQALTALEEAGDFIPGGARLEADVDLPLVVSSHRTEVLKNHDLTQHTALTAAQHYFTYAQQRLVVACGGLAEASRALVGLGRIQSHLHSTAGDSGNLVGPRSMALYQSALVIHPRNFEAANELGVLLARFGQFDDAKQALLQGVHASPRPEIWNNLAAVHESLGEIELAQRARIEARDAQQYALASPALEAVRWISPDEMANFGQADASLRRPPSDLQPTSSPIAQRRGPQNSTR